MIYYRNTDIGISDSGGKPLENVYCFSLKHNIVVTESVFKLEINFSKYIFE